MRIYLASPLGFAESTRGFLPRLLEAVTECGLEPVDPWSLPNLELLVEAERLPLGDERLGQLREANHKIAAANEAAVRSCDFVLAVLDGSDVDSGTASEVGFAYALGKRIVGLRSDFRRSGENDGSIVNLQVQYWVEASGGRIVSSLRDLKAELRIMVASTSFPGTLR